MSKEHRQGEPDPEVKLSIFFSIKQSLNTGRARTVFLLVFTSCLSSSADFSEVQLSVF